MENLNLSDFVEVQKKSIDKKPLVYIVHVTHGNYSRLRFNAGALRILHKNIEGEGIKGKTILLDDVNKIIAIKPGGRSHLSITKYGAILPATSLLRTVEIANKSCFEVEYDEDSGCAYFHYDKPIKGD